MIDTWNKGGNVHVYRYYIYIDQVGESSVPICAQMRDTWIVDNLPFFLNCSSFESLLLFVNFHSPMIRKQNKNSKWGNTNEFHQFCECGKHPYWLWCTLLGHVPFLVWQSVHLQNDAYAWIRKRITSHASISWLPLTFRSYVGKGLASLNQFPSCQQLLVCLASICNIAPTM